MDRRFQLPRMWMPYARQRGMNRSDRELEPLPLQREHLHVAKGLREHGITRIKVAQAQRVERLRVERLSGKEENVEPESSPPWQGLNS